MAKRKYPPSYYRYRETHPAISVRLTKSLKEALDAYRGDLSYAKAIRKLLEEKEDWLWEMIDPKDLGDFDVVITSGVTTRAMLVQENVMIQRQ
jgi:hypothetical protein